MKKIKSKYNLENYIKIKTRIYRNELDPDDKLFVVNLTLDTLGSASGVSHKGQLEAYNNAIKLLDIKYSHLLDEIRTVGEASKMALEILYGNNKEE